MARKVGTVLTAAASIAQVAAAVHNAVHQKPSWKDRKLKYALVVGIGERWSSIRLQPSDPRRFDSAAPARLYEVIDIGVGATIHVAYRDEPGGTHTAFVGFDFDPPAAGNLYTEKLARRAADFLAEAGIPADLEKLKA